MFVGNQVSVFIGQRHGCRARGTRDAVLVIRASIYIIFVLEIWYHLVVSCCDSGREVLRLRRVLAKLSRSHVFGATKASLRARFTMTHRYCLIGFCSDFEALTTLACASFG